MTKEERIEEYKDTVHICTNGFYLNNNDDMIHLPKADFDDMVLYDRRFYKAPITIAPMHNATIEVVNNDTLSDAKNLVEAGYNVTVLNMASSYLPGGGVMKGSGAQEEDLFRRTTLMNYLYQLHPIGKDFGFSVPKSHIFYPIDGTYDLIWCPNVSVIKGAEKDGFGYLDTPFNVNVITCAALRKPQLTKDNTLTDEDCEKMHRKIESILCCASIITSKKNALVLGAFGCGAYGNPPEQIAKIFHEEMNNCPSLCAIDTIHFAIIDSNSVGEKHNPQGNFKPFLNEFVHGKN